MEYIFDCELALRYLKPVKVSVYENKVFQLMSAWLGFEKESCFHKLKIVQTLFYKQMDFNRKKIYIQHLFHNRWIIESADFLKGDPCNIFTYSPKHSDPKIVCHSNLSPSLIEQLQSTVLPSPVREQVTILDIQLASDSNEKAILGHYISDLEPLSRISSTYEISEVLRKYNAKS